jgi:polyisoprenoid-binding protein YceI
VTTLKTGNDHRDRDLNKSMESGKYPEIRFDLERVSAAGPAVGDSLPVTLHGTLHIHGVDRAIDAPATVARLTDGTRVHSDFPLDLKDYRIGGLSKMLGLVKMHPDIVVHVDVVFAR